MVKELVEQLKTYKELVAIIAAAIAGLVFVVNYFATREALDAAQKKLDSLITQRECELSNRIAVAEVTLEISRLDKDRLDKSVQRKELKATSRNAPAAVRALLDDQVSALDVQIKEITDQITSERKVAAEAQRVLSRRECGAKVLARGDVS